MKKKKTWYEYIWLASSLYLILGLFNILFAWLGVICFIIPLLISIFRGNKNYCNKYCGRGQLFDLIGNRFKFSRNKPLPKFLRTEYFRYGLLAFFMAMFINMLFSTYLVFSNVNSLNEVLTIFWTFKLPWNFTDLTNVTHWIAQFSFGFYSMMLTSALIGLISMYFFKPRSWCV